MDFSWDPNKAASNQTKHGVSFETAKAVFGDQAAIIEIDDDDDTEERWRIIGMTAGSVLFVVFAEPDGAAIRIISARRANRHEQNRYYRQAYP